MQMVSIQLLRVCALFSACLMAACDNSQKADETAQITGTPTPEQLLQLEANTTLFTSFATPNAQGNFSPSLNTINKGNVRNRFGNGYAYELGRDGTAFTAQVGLLPQNDLGTLPMSGFTAFRGEYQVLEAGKSDGDLREFGAVQRTAGVITLRADFDFGTLTGTAGDLNIDGTFNSGTLSGAAFFQQRRAEMRGQIGDQGAVGVFHNTNGETALVGGFTVSP